MGELRKSSAARADLLEHFVYLFEEAGERVADRFLESAEQSFARLMTHPQIGRALVLSNPALAGMRKWSVTGFENFLIFYRPSPGDSIDIVRVLHRSRDWWELFGLVE